MRTFYRAMFCAFLVFGLVGITSNTNYTLTDHNESVASAMHKCHKAGFKLCHAETDRYVDRNGNCQAVVNVYGYPKGATIPVANAEQVYTGNTCAPCQEDEPCWDCHTMGNRVCGPPARPEGQG